MLSQKLENFLAEFSTMNENSKEKSSIIIFAAFQALYLTAVENNAIDENSLRGCFHKGNKVQSAYE